MKNKYLIPTIFLGLLTFLAAGAGADEFKLDSPDNIALHNVTVQAATYHGRIALKVELTDAIQRRVLQGQGSNFPAFAIPPADFRNGIIEIDLAGELNGKGAPDARAFVGVAFHIPADKSTYEAVYLRMTNGRLATPHPDRTPYPREPFNTRPIPASTGRSAERIFLAGTKRGPTSPPACGFTSVSKSLEANSRRSSTTRKSRLLTVSDLKFGDATGKIGLWVDDGTAAYFFKPPHPAEMIPIKKGETYDEQT